MNEGGRREHVDAHLCQLPGQTFRATELAVVLGDLAQTGQMMSPTRAGRIVQRLLELETYRLKVLRGLPVAKQLAPQLTRMETAWPTMPSA